MPGEGMRSLFRNFAKRARRVLWGEACVSCGKMDAGDEVLCPLCAAAFQRKLAEKCPDCGSPRFECYCMPPRLSDAGCGFLAKLAAYSPKDTECPVNRIIWRQKRVRDRESAAFLAELLSVPVREMFKGLGIDPAEVTVTYVPRDPDKVLAAGHDQARLLAAAMAESLGTDCRRLIDRSRGATEQKKLTAEERSINVRRVFSLSRRVGENELEGKTVLLIVDLVTTGATAAACVSVLAGAGARVFCASVAFTPLKTEKTE